MHPAIPRLIDLQVVDHHIAAVRAELETFPKLIQQADLKLTNARAGVAAAKEAQLNTQKERKKFELDVDQWKERARKYRDQTGAVKTNEAYKALLHEIVMSAEDTDSRLKQAESILRQDEQLVATIRHDIQAKNTAKKKGLEAAL